MNPKVDKYLGRANTWREEQTRLRKFVLDCGLTEELKWGVPCYTFNNKNIVLIHAFKEYCALLFVKGALLKDAACILVQQTENVQAARQIRFTSVEDIVDKEKQIKSYVYEAIEVEKAGLKIELKKSSEFDMAEEFKVRLKSNPALKKAFNALTPGRQRAYLLYFSAAKQSKTRESRVEKCVEPILQGKGLND